MYRQTLPTKNLVLSNLVTCSYSLHDSLWLTVYIFTLYNEAPGRMLLVSIPITGIPPNTLQRYSVNQNKKVLVLVAETH